MKDEIKEILEDVKRHLDYVEATKQASIRDNEMKAMYDYITNLQEENENRISESLSYDLAKAKIKELEYKIDKATKELEKLLPLCIMPNNTLIHGTEKAKVIEKAINILQRKSDEGE